MVDRTGITIGTENYLTLKKIKQKEGYATYDELMEALLQKWRTKK